MKKTLIIAGAGLGLLVVLLVILAFSLGAVIRKGVETVGPQATGVPVTLSRCALNPLSGTVSIGGFALGNPPGFTAGNAFSLQKASVAVQTGSLFSDVVVVKSVRVDGAEVTWEGLGGDNFRKIAANAQAFADRMGAGRGGAKEQAPAKQKKIIIDDFLLTNTRLHLVLGGKSMGTIPLPEIHLTGIGRDTGGAGVGEVVKKVLGGIGSAATSAVSKGGAAITDIGSKGLDAVKGLFK
jgi:hypothetical protein